MWADWGTILLGTVLLVLGTDSMTNGVSGLLARRSAAAYPPALAGALVAALAPALSIVIAASMASQVDLALGSLVGGAIAQLGLLLGLAAMVAPLRARLKVLNAISPALLLALVLAWALGLDHVYSRVDGAVLMLGFALALVVLVPLARRDRSVASSLFTQTPAAFGLSLLMLRLGIGTALTAVGAWQLVAGSAGIAGTLALNPLIAGMLVLGPASTMAGLPSALLAARRGRGDFALGQGLFAALANVLLLLGGLALWQPLATPASLEQIELPIVFALALAVYPMMRSDGILSRREGGMLLTTSVLLVAIELWLTLA